MDRPLIIYHGNCADGFGAAYAAWSVGNAAEFYPGVYQKDPPDVTDRIVYMLDFCYKRPIVLEMAKKALSITIIDHHASAMADICNGEPLPDNIDAIFDMHKSGAMLAWEFFLPFSKPSPLIRYIQDRDLWKHELPDTQEVNSALFSYPYDFAVWDGLMRKPIKDLVAEGTSILRKQRKDLNELLPQVKRPMTIAGHTVDVANLPYMFASEAGLILSEGKPFGGTYFDTPEGRNFSLRSREDGLDVSEIAKAYGGGGHKHAAGFRVPRNAELAVS